MIVTSHQLEEELAKGALVLLDVREPHEYHQTHLDDAVHIPLGELNARAKDELQLGDNIVCYCAHGVRSLEGLMILKSLGFDRVRSLEGGIVGWMEYQSQKS